MVKDVTWFVSRKTRFHIFTFCIIVIIWLSPGCEYQKTIRIVFITFVKLEGEEDYSQSQLHAFQILFGSKLFISWLILAIFFPFLTIKYIFKSCLWVGMPFLKHMKHFISRITKCKGNKTFLCRKLLYEMCTRLPNWKILKIENEEQK